MLFVWGLCDVVRNGWIGGNEELGHRDLEGHTYSSLFKVHRQRLIPDVALKTRQEVSEIARSNSATCITGISVTARKLGLETHLSGQVG
jgi:hypothetical protein